MIHAALQLIPVTMGKGTVTGTVKGTESIILKRPSRQSWQCLICAGNRLENLKILSKMWKLNFRIPDFRKVFIPVRFIIASYKQKKRKSLSQRNRG